MNDRWNVKVTYRIDETEPDVFSVDSLEEFAEKLHTVLDSYAHWRPLLAHVTLTLDHGRKDYDIVTTGVPEPDED